jgi:hypothetical protein
MQNETNNTEKYLEFEKQLSVHQSKSKFGIKMVIFGLNFFRLLTTKTFDFLASLSLMIVITTFIAGFGVNILIGVLVFHFIYWITLYRYLSKFFTSTLNEDVTLMISILEKMLADKK